MHLLFAKKTNGSLFYTLVFFGKKHVLFSQLTRTLICTSIQLSNVCSYLFCFKLLTYLNNIKAYLSLFGNFPYCCYVTYVLRDVLLPATNICTNIRCRH